MYTMYTRHRLSFITIIISSSSPIFFNTTYDEMLYGRHRFSLKIWSHICVLCDYKGKYKNRGIEGKMYIALSQTHKQPHTHTPSRVHCPVIYHRYLSIGF